MAQPLLGNPGSLSILTGSTGLSQEDARIVRGLRAGIEQAYEELIERYEQQLYGMMFRLLGNQTDAADVVQEVFLKVFRTINSFREQSSLKTWIYRIAVNEAHNHRRWFARHCRCRNFHGRGARRQSSEPVGVHGGSWTFAIRPDAR